MLINAPQVDYVRCTTFSQDEFILFSEVFNDFCDVQGLAPQSGKVPRYEGQVAALGSLFLGQGMQKLDDIMRQHWIVQCSGSMAHDFFALLSAKVPDARCTRIDLQITIELPLDYSARGLHDVLALAAWPGPKLKSRLVEGGDQYDTVYIGSRKSDRLHRIYVKQAGEVDYLRFEVEYLQRKSSYARDVWAALSSGEASIGQFLTAELLRLPPLNEPAIMALDSLLQQDEAGLSRPMHVSDMESTYRWFKSAVMPSVDRLMNDHDLGPKVVARLVVSLARYYERLNDEDVDEALLGTGFKFSRHV